MIPPPRYIEHNQLSLFNHSSSPEKCVDFFLLARYPQNGWANGKIPIGQSRDNSLLGKTHGYLPFRNLAIFVVGGPKWHLSQLLSQVFLDITGKSPIKMEVWIGNSSTREPFSTAMLDKLPEVSSNSCKHSMVSGVRHIFKKQMLWIKSWVSEKERNATLHHQKRGPRG